VTIMAFALVRACRLVKIPPQAHIYAYHLANPLIQQGDRGSQDGKQTQRRVRRTDRTIVYNTPTRHRPVTPPTHPPPATLTACAAAANP